jgi:tetratricopeptide (TPR) repeat protein
MAHEDMPSDVGEHLLAEGAALHLLAAATFGDVLSIIDTMPPAARPRLADALTSLERSFRESGHSANEQLCSFLAALCQSPGPFSGPTAPGRPSDAPPGDGGPVDFAGLLDLARSAGDLPTAYALLRAHRSLVPEESPVRAAIALVRQRGQDRLEYARVIAALGLLADDGPGQVTGRADWATFLHNHGHHRRALFHAGRALAAQHAVGDAASLSHAYMTLAATLSKMGDAEGHLRVLREGLAACEAVDDVPPADVAALHIETAGALAGLHRYHEALSHLAAASRSDTSSRADLHKHADVLLLHASVWHAVGALAAASGMYRRVLDAATPWGGRTRRLAVVGRLAKCLTDRGREREATRLLEEEVAVGEREAWNNIAPLRAHLGRAFLRQGDPKRAQLQLARSLLDATVPAPFWPDVGEVFITLGDLALSEGRTEEARRYYQDACCFEPGPRTDPHQPPVLITERLLDQSPLPELREWFGRLLAETVIRLRDRLDLEPRTEGHPPKIRLTSIERRFHLAGTREEREAFAEELRTGLRQAAQCDAWSVVKQLTVPVATVVARTYGAPAAERLLREILASEEAHGRGDDTLWLRLALVRTLVGRPDGEQAAFDELWACRRRLLERHRYGPAAQSADEIAGQALPVYEELLSLLLPDDGRGCRVRLPDSRPADVLAFDLHEEGKSRGIVQALARLPLPQPPGVPSELIDVEKVTQWALGRELVSRERSGIHDGPREDLLTALRQRLDRALAVIGPMAPEYARLRRAEGIDTGGALELVRRHAPAEGLLLASYFVGERSTFCFTIASGELRLRTYRIPMGRAALHTSANAVRRVVDGDRTVFPHVPGIRARRPTPLPLEGLSALLPFQEDLSGGQLLCVAPHGPLAVLPLNALRLPDGAYLGERAALVYTPSVSALEYLLVDPPAPPVSALYVGVAALEDQRPDGGAEGGAKEPEHVGFENYALPEAEGVRVTSLRGAAARPEAVLEALADSDLAYVACHGQSGKGDPEDAALILSDGERRTSRDTGAQDPGALPFLLRARDLNAPRGLPRTVILRACSAGWHDPAHQGEDFTGLTLALLRGGTRTVVAPVWQVYGPSSAELLDGLTRDLMGGVPVWKAVWRAQRRFLTDRERPHLAHPYHWAGFVPLGDWR